MAIPGEPEPEFARPVAVERLGSEPLIESIAAMPAERAALAERFGLAGLDRLEATVRLERRPGSTIVTVTGDLSAAVVQTCVVTLDPLPMEVEESFCQRFTTAPAAAVSELVLAAEGDCDDDEPEPLDGDTVDIGELVAQYLYLALDPYPRKPGVRFAPDEAGTGGKGRASGAESPFAALGRLRGTQRS